MQEQNYYLKIGQIIKELREKQNMTKTQLADGICSISYITRIEKGERCPTSVILRQITNKLGISPEHLFRAIESSTSLHVKELLDQIFLYIERHDFKNIYELIKSKKEELHVTSIHDLQIIKGLECFSYSILNQNYQWGINEVKNILKLTYANKSTPTDMEFALMSMHGVLLLFSNQKKEAYNYLISIKKYIHNINLLHTRFILPRFYVYLISASLDTCNLKDCFEYLDYAINYCKDYNTHYTLRELYFLKSELYYRLKKEKKFKLWYGKALRLHELIKRSDDEYFNTFIQNRLNQLK
ncbi:helix-turn-helix domain-containing protein [Tepidibacter aestuarii]|uniref:helix-turn-helix domain-containing protein n=1 Tax=Tepidibacter aestuarii TaxID=2925782 RepID=UPI0020BDF509|nr:helix-turn-helix transcriptional regulator [Tepidibacter aestuarii]CAH2213404.1 HTH cro/C1-type domain-containing protein [Tepidibacter aestuarii]